MRRKPSDGIRLGVSASNFDEPGGRAAEKEAHVPRGPPPVYDETHPDVLGEAARRSGAWRAGLGDGLPDYDDLARLPPLQLPKLPPGAPPASQIRWLRKALTGQSWKVTMEPPLSWLEQLYVFTQNTTFHGIRFVFDVEGIIFRRLTWAVIITTMFYFFTRQMVLSIQRLESNPTVDQRAIEYVSNQTFPAISICNHNLFRTSVAAENGFYDALSGLFGNDTEVSQVSTEKLRTSNVTETMLALAHQKEDLIFRCRWQNQPCPEGSVDRILSDQGVCYTFNWNASGPLLTENAGSNYGLSLVLNVEQYEYMAGPRKTAGVRVIIHSAQTVVDPTENGIDVPPGYQASVGISETRISTEGGNAKCPNSTLRYWRDAEYTADTCTKECESDYIEEVCRCHRVQVPNALGILPNQTLELCSLYDKYVCVDSAIALLKDRGAEVGFNCSVHCNQTCDSSTYNPVLSYSSLSRYNAEKILADERANIAAIRRNFQRAREFNARFSRRRTDSDQANFQAIETIFVELGRELIEPNATTLLALGGRLLNVSCFRNARHIVARYREFLSVGIAGVEALPVFAYERSFFLRSFRLILDTLGGDLEAFRKAADGVLAGPSDRAQTVLSTKVTLERFKAIGYVGVLARRLAEASVNLEVYVDAQPYLLNLTSFASVYETLGDFRREVGVCVQGLNSSLDYAFARLANDVESGLISRSGASAALEGPLAAKRSCEAVLVNFAPVDRELWAAAVGKELEDIDAAARAEFRAFDAFAGAVARPGITLTGARGIQSDFRRLQRLYETEVISKLELAGEVTNEDFIDKVEYYVNFLGLVDRYLFRADDAMNGYLRQFGRINELTPPVIQELLKARENADYRLYFQRNLFTPEEVEHCIENRTRAAVSDVKRELQSQLTRFQTNWRRLRSQLQEYKSSSTLDAEFVLTNFAQVLIFFRNMQIESVRKEPDYVFNDFITEIGGTIGLFFGASFLTVVELVDVFLYTSFKKYMYQRHQYLQRNELQQPSNFLTSKLVT